MQLSILVFFFNFLLVSSIADNKPPTSTGINPPQRKGYQCTSQFIRLDLVNKAVDDCKSYLKKPGKKNKLKNYYPSIWDKTEVSGTSFLLYPIRKNFSKKLADMIRLEKSYLIANQDCERAGVLSRTQNLKYRLSKLVTNRFGARTLEKRCKNMIR
ncbi:hypothetical protein GcM3_06081 [Golovinomyces cichoracearum]|uniref:Secreted effector protein n=1 Tax=Golovinomyces cichoracearum TaxID=62708 RepID=A0A420H9Y4_9PEZI|nr:hypothetical protein GcM3_06081 [Golovinomyces cichoracearum]